MNVLTSYNGYRVARATPLDVRRLRRLEREVFPKDAYSLLELTLLTLTPYIRNYKILAPDGNLVGFVSGSPSLSGNPGWIITLGIAAAYQRQGLGRFLLGWCESRLNAQRIRLTVRAGNLPAIGLYEQCGYVHVRRRLRYYPDGEDGLEMEKGLDAAPVPPPER
jgi:ribosomal-protein-alanine N-acetyltransferase